MANILYVHLGRTTFVRKDLELLATQHQMIEHAFHSKQNLAIIGTFWKQLVFLLTKGWRAKLVIVQFAGYHSLLPALWARLRGIPCLIVASGTESASYPSISYGNFAKPAQALFTRWSFRMADHVAPVHRSLAASENNYYPNDGIQQGFTHHVKGLELPITEIPYGFDAEKWPFGEEKKPSTFITVAHIPNRVRYILKGIDMVVAMGRRFPNCDFYVVGIKYSPTEEIPANVHLIEAVAHQDLPAFLGDKQYYFQLSISEGHPNALCEGMLCGCVPIASSVTSMPEVVGETGFLVPHRDEDTLAEAVSRALEADVSKLGADARARIEKLYPLEMRREKLLKLTQELLATD